ncbi:MAG: hypothetical protein KGL11_12810 [Alphaproteobacteria bacterium]|nr:hypothetical protein [Alphaproteobacteria bacterium]
MTNTTIALGGRDYALRPLTLGQLRVVLPAFARAAKLNAADGIDAAIDILAAALARDHASLTRDALLELEVLPADLAAAVARIAELSGLVPKEGDGTGESPADR